MIDLSKLAIATRARRGKRSLREAAEECGMPFTTLGRIENGGKPDLDNFTRVCQWIGVPMEYFVSETCECETE